jgi:hypothetical protein
MIPTEQWKEVCFNGVYDAYRKKSITLHEAGKLRVSIKQPIDEGRMDNDTRERTGGVCPTQTEAPDIEGKS